MSILLAINGKASANDVKKLIERFRADKPVDEVAIIVRGTLRSVTDTKTASRGKDHVASFTMDSAILATGEEADELLERLTEARAEAEGDATAGGTGNLADSIADEYSGQSHAQLRKLCKDRDINAKGSRLELAQRLRDVG